MTDQQAQPSDPPQALATVSPDFRAQLPGSLAAPPERTLVDILRDTAARFPDASALDDGHESLSYAQLTGRGPGQGEGAAPGRPRCRGQDRRQDSVRHQPALCLDPGHPDGRGGVRPGGRGRPGRARPAGVRRGPGRRHITRRRRDCDGGPAAPPVPCAAASRPGRRRLGHLHLGFHRDPQRRGGAAPFLRRPSSTPKPASSCRTIRSGRRTGSWPGCRSPSTPPARRCGSPGGTAPASSRRPGPWSGPAWTLARG